ncbi:MAG: type III pantothenate kinase [Prevotellaceae bacterium]|jgi:type III pantothenate kinase|nr:type III pantothenate kinase [Prevotellaceae bacterium]
MNLLIDIGNSGAKVAIADKGRFLTMKHYNKLTFEALLPFLEQYCPEAAICSSVADENDQSAICKMLGKYVKKIIPFNHTTPVPIKNCYATPETLGIDRLAAAVGANHLFPATDCLIFDCGTALTIDILSRNGEFLGGNISPGMQTRFKALNTFTAKLPLEDIAENVPLMGTTTTTAIQAGVFHGLSYEIETYINKNPHCTIIFSGGDALFFVRNIKKSIFVVCNLVLIGLNQVINNVYRL